MKTNIGGKLLFILAALCRVFESNGFVPQAPSSRRLQAAFPSSRLFSAEPYAEQDTTAESSFDGNNANGENERAPPPPPPPPVVFNADEVMGQPFLVNGEDGKQTYQVNVVRKIQNYDSENPNFLVEMGEGDGMIEEVLSYSGVADLVQRGRQRQARIEELERELQEHTERERGIGGMGRDDDPRGGPRRGGGGGGSRGVGGGGGGMRGGSLAGPSTMMNGEFGGNYRSGGDRRGYRDVGVNGDMGYRTTGGGLAYPGGYRGGDMVRAGGYRGGSLARYGGGGIGRYGGGGYRHGHDNWRRIDGGNALKTFSFEGPVEAVQVDLLSEGRPIEADVELWQGPNNIPIKMKVHSDDGDRHPMSVVMDTPGTPNTIAVRNTAPQEFPIEACVTASSYRPHFVEPPVEVQGGALRTFELNPYVERVAIMLETDGRPLNATIELMRGPNYQSQVVEVYADDGLYRPVFLVFDVPMHGCAVRVINTASLEFPITAWVEPYGGGGGRGYGGGYGRGVRERGYGGGRGRYREGGGGYYGGGGLYGYDYSGGGGYRTGYYGGGGGGYRGGRYGDSGGYGGYRGGGGMYGSDFYGGGYRSNGQTRSEYDRQAFREGYDVRRY